MKKKGKGLLDVLKKGLSVAKQISDVTGIKPSHLLASSGHPAALLGSALLGSQGLGKKKKSRCPCVKGGMGNMKQHMMEDRAMMGKRSHVRRGGLQTQSGVNNYPSAASIGVARF